MGIGDDTTLAGGSEIRDDETACLAIDQGLARVYGDRVYWIDGCGPDDLMSEQEWEDRQIEMAGDTYLDTMKDGGF